MKQLIPGQFYGQTNARMNLGGLIITDTEYTHDKVDWHYHENAYFTFILQGQVTEGNKKEILQCTAGSLLYHHWQEPHYNIKPNVFTRGFHIEIEPGWLKTFELDVKLLQGSVSVSNPDIKILMYKIFRETKLNDVVTDLSIHDLMVNIFCLLENDREKETKDCPAWVNKVKEKLHDDCTQKISLADLSNIASIHPVHLSRSFSRYFQCSMGDYTRKLKIEKSFSLLSDRKKTLTDISFDCGFADQSHFTRSFREMTGLNPSAYRRILQQ
jgi:AraC-like DNA-binding protein